MTKPNLYIVEGNEGLKKERQKLAIMSNVQRLISTATSSELKFNANHEIFGVEATDEDRTIKIFQYINNLDCIADIILYEKQVDSNFYGTVGGKFIQSLRSNGLFVGPRSHSYMINHDGTIVSSVYQEITDENDTLIPELSVLLGHSSLISSKETSDLINTLKQIDKI
jgi:hypothetical protein